MSALHLIFQHWFLSIILMSCTASAIRGIILAIKGKDVDKETP
jgi:hypothetical protein